MCERHVLDDRSGRAAILVPRSKHQNSAGRNGQILEAARALTIQRRNQRITVGLKQIDADRHAALGIAGQGLLRLCCFFCLLRFAGLSSANPPDCWPGRPQN